MLFRHKHAVVYGMSSLIGACLILAVMRPAGTSTGNWLNSAGLLLDILGLVLLEISGVFDRIMLALEAAGKEGLAPSHLVRQVIDNPDEQEWRRRLRWWLFSEPKTGIHFIVAGCLAQLAGTWL